MRVLARQMPDKLLALEYPDRFETRLVSGNGGVLEYHSTLILGREASP